MTSAVHLTTEERYDVRTMVGGGIKLGLLTAAGVVVFALVSRALGPGTFERTLQSLFVLAGAAVASYLPASWVRPRSTDGIAWAALLGLLGALAFTVVDTAVLRPLTIYHWTWDAIGGGSGFWYVPVWWMGSAVLAWLGAWVVAAAARGGAKAVWMSAAQTAGLAIVLLGMLTVTGLAPFHPAVMALAFALGLPLHVAIAVILGRR